LSQEVKSSKAMDESSAEPLDPQQLRERIEEEEGGSAFILRIE